ncbi:MAG: hypothetical protein ACR2NT_05070 [Acidimicrobiia bacterium]
MSRTHAHHRRRRSSGPRVRGAIYTTWGRAMELAAECLCPLGIEPGHGCHVLDRWKGEP